MQLGLTQEQELLQHTFAELFAAESSPERVRAAEATGVEGFEAYLEIKTIAYPA